MFFCRVKMLKIRVHSPFSIIPKGSSWSRENWVCQCSLGDKIGVCFGVCRKSPHWDKILPNKDDFVPRGDSNLYIRLCYILCGKFYKLVHAENPPFVWNNISRITTVEKYYLLDPQFLTIHYLSLSTWIMERSVLVRHFVENRHPWNLDTYDMVNSIHHVKDQTPRT